MTSCRKSKHQSIHAIIVIITILNFSCLVYTPKYKHHLSCNPIVLIHPYWLSDVLIVKNMFLWSWSCIVEFDIASNNEISSVICLVYYFFKVLHGQIICISTTLFAHFRNVIWSSFVWFTRSPMQWKTLSLLHRSSFLSVLIILKNLDCVCVFLLSSIVCMFAHTHTQNIMDIYT